ncbi:MAG: hypothetical protein KDA96_11465 [Planctomycetaceae bacterium]|nr:hypothetical protein [Planctomycetaceae bacterium]
MADEAFEVGRWSVILHGFSFLGPSGWQVIPRLKSAGLKVDEDTIRDPNLNARLSPQSLIRCQ